jgi:hypothetical protein
LSRIHAVLAARLLLTCRSRISARQIPLGTDADYKTEYQSVTALHVPKDTKPPLVVRWCTDSPRSSGGGIADQLHLGAFE